MAKQKAEVVPERTKYTLPVKSLAEAAHQIAKLRPNEIIILNKLKEIYSDAVDDGAQYILSALKHKKEKREARIKNSYDSFVKNFDDTIHGGVVAKNATTENENNSQ